MPVAEPQLNDRGFPADAHRVVLAGSIEGLQFPPLCSNCAAPAAGPLPVAKVFQYNYGSTDDGGWRYRITRAAPLFCRDCIARHQAEAVPVTGIDRLRSVVFSELAIPALGTATFALFLLRDMGAKPWRNLSRDWPLLALVAGPLLIAAFCLRTAWQNNALRRVPRQTPTSSAFDFGDNEDSPFQTTARTYADWRVKAVALAEWVRRSQSFDALKRSGIGP
jgi:hypothetical protein